MYLFDIFFYSLFTLVTIATTRVFRSPKKKSKRAKLANGLVVTLAVLFWVWEAAILFTPRGNKIQEAVHLPRHFWALENAPLTSIEGEKIAYGKDEKQYIVYHDAPEGSTKNTVVFYIHGGGWHTGSPSQHRHLASLLHREGYTVVMPAYRLGPVHNCYQIKNDIDSALVKSMTIMKDRGITDSKIIIGGTSAGGNLAGLLAYDEDRWDDLGLDRNSLQGIFSIVAPLDLSYMDENSVLNNYAGSKGSEQFEQANAISYISQKDCFPLLCMHGTEDGLVPIQSAESFCNKLKEVDPELIEFHSFPNKSHLEIGSAWYYSQKNNYGQDSILVNWLNKR